MTAPANQPPAPAPKRPPHTIDARCPVCRGSGWIETGIDRFGYGVGRECRACDGRGRVMTNGGEV